MPLPCRKPTRIPNYDYSSDNYYFVTICTHEKKCIFGQVDALNTVGKIAFEDLEKIESHYTGVKIDNFVVMPNHIHMIIIVRNQAQMVEKAYLDKIVGQYKSGVTRKIRKIKPNMKVWQRSFHDHIIRNQRAYEKIWNYVEYNTLKWEEDCFFPTR